MPKQTSVAADAAKNVQDNLDFIFIIRYRDRIKTARIACLAYNGGPSLCTSCKEEEFSVNNKEIVFYSTDNAIAIVIQWEVMCRKRWARAHTSHNGSNHSGDKPENAERRWMMWRRRLQKKNTLKKIWEVHDICSRWRRFPVISFVAATMPSRATREKWMKSRKIIIIDETDDLDFGFLLHNNHTFSSDTICELRHTIERSHVSINRIIFHSDLDLSLECWMVFLSFSIFVRCSRHIYICLVDLWSRSRARVCLSQTNYRVDEMMITEIRQRFSCSESKRE